MQQKFLLGINPLGFHKIAYTDWGDSPKIIICMHGLTRNGRDFDYLAENLSNNYRIICPDLPGRGASEKFNNPRFYNQAQYAADATSLIARTNAQSIIWIGTSLGGALGMYLASLQNTPIKALVLNDIGPVISKIGISRISKYANKELIFATMDDVENYLRRAYNTSEEVTDEQWRQLAKSSVYKLDGQYTLAYDPNAGNGLRKWWIGDIKLWSWWSKIQCPVLVLRGARSDILLPETVARMQTEGPDTTVFEIPGCGHAPMLMTRDQIDMIQNWLSTVAV